MNTLLDRQIANIEAQIVRGVKRVLCAVEVDRADDRAFTTALALCRSFDAKLHIVHVIPPAARHSADAIERQDYLRDLRARGDAAQVDAWISVEHGVPARVLAATAAYHKTDLVIVGRPRRPVADVASVAECVLREASCPTLVVPASISQWGLGFERVLCAVDLAGRPSALLAAARMLAGPSAAVNLLHVLETAASDEADADQRLAVAALRQLQRAIPPAGDGMTSATLAKGERVDAVLQAARAFSAELIVCGARRYSESLQRSTIALLMHRAVCPILAVPAARHDGSEHPAARFSPPHFQDAACPN